MFKGKTQMHPSVSEVDTREECLGMLYKNY